MNGRGFCFLWRPRPVVSAVAVFPTTLPHAAAVAPSARATWSGEGGERSRTVFCRSIAAAVGAVAASDSQRVLPGPRSPPDIPSSITHVLTLSTVTTAVGAADANESQRLRWGGVTPPAAITVDANAVAEAASVFS